MIAARLDADSFYDDVALRLTLGLRYATVARARLEDALRSTRRGGKILYRGDWVMALLEGEDAPGHPARRVVGAC